MNFKGSVCTAIALVLLGCASSDVTPPSSTSATLQSLQAAQREESAVQGGELGQLPAQVREALQPQSTNAFDDSLFGAPKFDIDANNVSARQFFAGLVDGTELNIAIHPDVTGNISLTLKQVTLAQVLTLVADLYGYDIQQNGPVFQVYPAGMRTETFAVNYLLMQRVGMTQTMINSGGVTQNGQQGGNNGGGGGFGGGGVGGGASGFSGNNLGGGNPLGGGLGGGMIGGMFNGTNISTTSQTDFWQNLEETLQSLIGEEGGRTVVTSPQAGLVTVRALPDEIRTVKQYLEVSEEHVQRQVVLEARILEVSLEDEFQQGINWNQVLANAGTTDFRFSSSGQVTDNTITAGLGGVTSLAFVNQDFSGVISLLSTQGNVQVLSSPRVTATNNQKAVIKVGDDEYFVTEVSTQNTITATATAVAPNIELTPFFSGIALDVTPQIDDTGSVLLHVHPSVIDTQEQEKIITLNEEQFVLPLAQSNIRESDTVIRARSGEIVVIGGLMQSISREVSAKTPLLGDIPWLGQLFTNRREIEQKQELIILLKPTVVMPGTWKEQLGQSADLVSDWLTVN